MPDAAGEPRTLAYASPGAAVAPSWPPVLNAAGLCGAITAVAVLFGAYGWADWAGNVVRIPRLWYQSERIPTAVGVAFVVANLAFLRRRSFCLAAASTSGSIVVVYACALFHAVD